MLTCPTCNSTLVIEMDEVPLPSHYRNDRGVKQSVAVDNGPLSSGLHSSPSQSSIGKQYVTLRCINIVFRLVFFAAHSPDHIHLEK
jgi:hypothetical protein